MVIAAEVSPVESNRGYCVVEEFNKRGYNAFVHSRLVPRQDRMHFSTCSAVRYLKYNAEKYGRCHRAHRNQRLFRWRWYDNRCSRNAMITHSNEFYPIMYATRLTSSIRLRCSTSFMEVLLQTNRKEESSCDFCSSWCT